MVNHRINLLLEWTACIVTICGAACTSLRIMPLNIYILNVGAVLYLIWAIRIRKPSLIVINVVLLAIYIMGLIVA
jgi:hypothetical protein